VLVFAASASESAGTLAFSVRFSGMAPCGFTVDYSTSDGTAQSNPNNPYGADYASTTGSVSFSGTDGEVQTVYISVNNENLVELNETFTLTLNSVHDGSGNAVAGIGIGTAGPPASGGSATGTIINDDEAIIDFGGGLSGVTEGHSGTAMVNITLSLSNPVDTAITVDWHTEDVTATVADNDYEAASGTVQWMAGITSFHFPSTIQFPVNGDLKVELDESLMIVLENIQASGRTVRFNEFQVGGPLPTDNVFQHSAL
jgi:hypothetical protein